MEIADLKEPEIHDLHTREKPANISGPQMSRYILVNLFCKFGTTILTPIYNIMLKYDQGARRDTPHQVKIWQHY
jgi:hypothetical protein